MATPAQTHWAPRCFAPPRRVRHAGERTERLRRRTLYETTAAQDPTLHKGAGRHAEPHATNGDAALAACAGGGALVRACRTHAARIDLAVGRVHSTADRWSDAALRRAQEGADAARGARASKSGALAETAQAVVARLDAARLALGQRVGLPVADVSFGAGRYNRVHYEGAARPAGAAVLAVDPCGNVAPHALDGHVAIRARALPEPAGALDAAAGASALLRARAEDAVFDACFGYPAPLVLRRC
jgi:hypothetical protein